MWVLALAEAFQPVKNSQRRVPIVWETDIHRRQYVQLLRCTVMLVA